MSRRFERSQRSLALRQHARFLSAVREHAARKALGKTPTDVQTKARTDTERIKVAGQDWLRVWRGDGTYRLIPA